MKGLAWASIVAASLAIGGMLAASWATESLTLAVGLAAVTFAVLALREK